MDSTSRVNRRSAHFVIAVFASFFLALPLIWMVLTSFKSSQEVLIYPPIWFPRQFRFENYLRAWEAAPFGKFYFNSVYTGVASTLLQVAFSLLMAYAFVFVPFRGKTIIFLAVLATMVVPIEMKLIPNYILLSRLRWINTYRALIIPPAAHAFPVLVMVQALKTVPSSLIEASIVDGAGRLRILYRIILPVSRPMLSALFLVSFVGRWNDYVWPLIITSRESMRTLPVGLSYLKEIQGAGGQWNLIMAASVFVIFPTLILFLFAQKQFVSGLTGGALKG